MTDVLIVSMVTAVTSLIGTTITSYFGLQIVRANKELKKTTDKTLQHVNHQVIAQAKNYAIATRINADLSTNPGYKKIADDAEAVLRDLIEAQKLIDCGDVPK